MGQLGNKAPKCVGGMFVGYRGMTESGLKNGSFLAFNDACIQSNAHLAEKKLHVLMHLG
jgi:hypothetical protein